ncbi:helicase associated domain-containing protein, partial [Embleya sp. NPDC005971]|uniref:helicase associated domain-containing protein n=1 Tax=Embleya sp. NPDC005971 TaxID=3156724 RepID=UPI0033C87292
MVDILAVPQVDGAAQEAARPFDVEDDESGVGGGFEGRRSLVWFSSRRDPVQLARFVRTRVLDPQRRNWLRGLAAAERYRERFGNLEIPLHTVDIDAHGVTFPVGGWVSEMRRAYAGGGLDRTQIAELEALGMVWDAYDRGWRDALAHAREYARLHVGLAAPVDAIIEGFPIGRQLQKWRQGNGMKRHPERAEQLAAIDPEWNPQEWSIDWQRHLNHLRHWQQTHNPPVVLEGGDGAAAGGGGPGVGVGADGSYGAVRCPAFSGRLVRCPFMRRVRARGGFAGLRVVC